MAAKLSILSLSIIAAVLTAILFIQIAIESNKNIQALGQTLVSTIYGAGGGGNQEQISQIIINTYQL